MAAFVLLPEVITEHGTYDRRCRTYLLVPQEAERGGGQERLNTKCIALARLDWSYIAGFFDAHGSMNINVKEETGSKYFHFRIQIYTHSSQLRASLKHFLRTRGMRVGESLGVNPLGTSHRLCMSRSEDIDWFLAHVQQHVIVKAKQVEIVREAIRLTKILHGEHNKRDKTTIRRIETLKRELHKYAMKGPR